MNDRGPGIPADVLPHVFDRYYRAPSTHATQGLGLGLYITRVIAELHGGSVEARSRVGDGSTFTIVLPAG